MARSDMRIIDAHAHIHLEREYSPRRLVRLMDKAGIELSAAFASAIGDGLPTADMLRKIAPYRDRLFGVATVSPFDLRYQPSLEQLDDWLASGEIRAIKVYTGYEHVYPADWRLRPFMDLLVKHKRPAIFHTGDLVCWHGSSAKLKFAHPLAVDDLAAEMPNLRIIIAHMGSPWIADAAQVCYKNKYVYTDCSGFVYGGFKPHHLARFTEYWKLFEDITEHQGKILFGTDWPVSDHGPYVEIVQDLAGKHRHKVFHGNAEKLFGL